MLPDVASLITRQRAAQLRHRAMPPRSDVCGLDADPLASGCARYSDRFWRVRGTAVDSGGRSAAGVATSTLKGTQ